MSEEQKIYINGVSAKQITFKSGKTIIKLNINVDRMIEQLERHRNEKGYVNLGISERREPGKYGETHTVWLDTWRPNQQGQQAAQPPLQTIARTHAAVMEQPAESQDGLPF